MESHTSGTPTGGAATTHTGSAALNRVRRFATETKQAFKTSEFWAFVVIVLGILISAAAIKGNDDLAVGDEFLARQAWLYVAIVTGAYLISRGLAKSGSQEPYSDDDYSGDRR